MLECGLQLEFTMRFMFMKSIWLLVVLASAGCRATSPDEPPVEAFVDPKIRDAELADLAGTWIYEQLVIEGKQVPIEILRNDSIVIDGCLFTRYIIRDGKKPDSEESTLHIDPTSNPKRYDDELHERRNKVRMKGIYKLEGDRLTMCFDNRGPVRPTSFESPVGSTFVLTVLRRKDKVGAH